MPELVDRIENALTEGLVHPGTGNGPIALPLPMFNNSAMPDEMARHFAEEAGLPHANVAKLVAEALVNVLENAGETGTAAAIRQAAETTPPPEVVEAAAPSTRPSSRRPTAPPPTGPRPTIPDGQPSGRMHVTLNGEVLMRDLGDWKQHPPQQILEHLQNPAKAPAWARALIAAIVDAATTGRGQHVDITTDGDNWTMRVSSNEPTPGWDNIAAAVG